MKDVGQTKMEGFQESSLKCYFDAFMWRNIHPSITFLTYSVRLAKPWD
uniref:Uncharacterized protein n=1 Tax=Anguilla anguilla TaxID=7936 RepID=A0A0E9XSK9_ANGAN